MMFVNRSDELDSLEKRYSSNNFEFIVLYGRRRVGKTELIKQFSKDRPHIYFLSPQDTELMQINKFLKKISDHFDEVKPDLDSWDACVDYLKSKLEEKKIIFSIDEFPYLVQNNRAILSYLQGMIDDIDSDSMLILCGSSVSVMESDVMGHKSPLFGRRTGQIDLQPFDFSTSLKSIRYPFEEAVRSYSITGGTPMYLLNFDYSRPLKDNIKDKILDKTSFMHEEPLFLLRAELRSPNRYLSILEALANGHTKPNSISNATGIDPGPLSKYLKTLRKLRLIKREIPVTAEQKRSKRSIYKIKDNFFRFWFQFIEPKKSWIEEAPKKVLTDDILPTLDIYTSKIFEDICIEYVWKNYDYHKVGHWWFKEDEIDIVALNEREHEILFGECKWSSDVNAKSLYYRLKEKKGEVRWNNDNRKERFVLFAKSFEDDFTKEDLTCVDLTQMENTIR